MLGDVTAQPIPGVAVFKVNGAELKLTALSGDAPKEGLFFVFNDLTAKSDTYPAGRFFIPSRWSMDMSSLISIAPTILRVR